MARRRRVPADRQVLAVTVPGAVRGRAEPIPADPDGFGRLPRPRRGAWVRMTAVVRVRSARSPARAGAAASGAGSERRRSAPPASTARRGDPDPPTPGPPPAGEPPPHRAARRTRDQPRRRYPWHDDPHYDPAAHRRPAAPPSSLEPAGARPRLRPPGRRPARPSRPARSAPPAPTPEPDPEPGRPGRDPDAAQAHRDPGGRDAQPAAHPKVMRAFHRAATADGADRSGLTALTYATMMTYAVDAAVAVALANTLFFAAATAESKTNVALYLAITVAPFAVVAPVIGPLLDRVQRGRRAALAVVLRRARGARRGDGVPLRHLAALPGRAGHAGAVQVVRRAQGGGHPRVLPPGDHAGHHELPPDHVRAGRRRGVRRGAPRVAAAVGSRARCASPRCWPSRAPCCACASRGGWSRRRGRCRPPCAPPGGAGARRSAAASDRAVGQRRRSACSPASSRCSSRS